jgi:hypothetical protein
MPDLPPGMYPNNRAAEQDFHCSEYLYRRVPLNWWEERNDPIELDAIELPDMPVLRGKYGHPEWARFDGGEYKYSNWGVVGFATNDIPTRLLDRGVFHFTFRPMHTPQKKNYPHSEIRAYEDETHIDLRDRLDHDLHLRWREQLLRRLKKFIGPNEDVEVRQDAPRTA